MIDYSVYKLTHLLGIMMVFLALGGVMVHALNRGRKVDNRWRKPAAVMHGVGLFLILLGGFGMLARLAIHWPWPGWVIAKATIWIVLGGLTVAMHHLGARGSALWYAAPLIGSLAAYFALFKPF